MGLFQRVFLGVLIIFVLESIQYGTARYDHSPIYFKIESNKYQFIYNVSYNAEDREYTVKAPNDLVLVACPSLREGSDFFVLRKIRHEEATVSSICEKPNKSIISKDPSDDKHKGDIRRIGFAIQEPPQTAFDKVTASRDVSLEIDFPEVEKPFVENLDTINEDDETLPVSDLVLEKTSSDIQNQAPETNETDQVPEYSAPEKSLRDKSDELIETSKKDEESEFPVVEKSPNDKPDEITEKNDTNQEPVRPPGNYHTIDLIVFKYDDSLNRIKFVWYNIIPGKLLSPEISFKMDETYETNEKIYGYDLDTLYSAASASGYLKVSLAPEDDFLFKYMKQASRQNILTAPMRYEILRHWQNLEKFTRKVTQIIDSVAVMTGIYGTLTKPDEESTQQPIYLHDGKHPIPSFFWKVISIEFEHNENLYRNGILFVLHNVDPNTKQDIKKICPDDEDAVSNTGWELPGDEKLKRLMYACLWNPVNMKALGEEEEYLENEVFNLNEVPTIRIEKNEKILETVNVIEIIKQNSGLNAAFNNFVNAFSYPFKFLASCFDPK